MSKSSVITNPQEFVIKNVDLLTASGTIINLKPVIKELSIYEDMFAGLVSGFVSLTDSQGFIEALNITGFNFIRVSFGKLNADNPNFSIDKYFRIHKIGETYPITRSNEEYIINFISEDVFMSEQKKVLKSYKEQKIKDIILDILYTDVQATEKTFLGEQNGTFEDTEGTYNFIISNKKPFQAIQWLCGYAKPAKVGNSGFGADMLFFENLNGYNFRSLQSMYDQSVYSEYVYGPQANYTPDEAQYLNYGLKNMVSFKVKNHFDSLQATNYGLYANKILTIDPLLQEYYVTEFKYDEYIKNAKKLNNSPLTSGYLNRDKKTVSETTDAVFKVMTTNRNQRQQPLVKADANILATVAPSIDIETYIPHRTAQLGLARYTVVEFGIYGDPNLAIGSKVKLNIPSLILEDSTGKKAYNKYYSGNYLVSAVRHMLDFRGRYFCTVEAITDSLSAPNILTDNSSGNIDRARMVS